jgi:hypothetical protein
MMHATDMAVQRLSPNPSGAARDYVEWRDRRAGVRATDADVNVCRLRAEKASGFAPRQTQDDVYRPPVRRVCRPRARFGALCAMSVAATDAGGFGVGHVCRWGVDCWNVERVGHMASHGATNAGAASVG